MGIFDSIMTAASEISGNFSIIRGYLELKPPHDFIKLVDNEHKLSKIDFDKHIELIKSNITSNQDVNSDHARSLISRFGLSKRLVSELLSVRDFLVPRFLEQSVRDHGPNALFYMSKRLEIMARAEHDDIKARKLIELADDIDRIARQ